jgi:hypothetical protein
MMKNGIFNILIIAALLLTAVGASSAQRKKASNSMDVKIYVAQELADESQYDEKNPSNLVPLKRRVDAKSPLRNTLIALTGGITRAEEKQGFVSVMFGIKFVSVRLENGTAYAYFTMPEGASFSGDLSPLIFRDAVERTARQFPQVKKVEVCLDGILDFWSESDEPPKKCS